MRSAGEYPVQTPDNDQIIHCTVGLYKLFLSGGKISQEAFRLYMHLQFTALLQGNRNVRANMVYLKRGTGFGEAKIKTLKSWLHQRGLISYVQPRHKSGAYNEIRIRINFLWNSEKLRTYLEAFLFKDQGEEEYNEVDDKQLLLVDNPVDNPDLTGGTETEPAVRGE